MNTDTVVSVVIAFAIEIKTGYEKRTRDAKDMRNAAALSYQCVCVLTKRRLHTVSGRLPTHLQQETPDTVL